MTSDAAPNYGFVPFSPHTNGAATEAAAPRDAPIGLVAFRAPGLLRRPAVLALPALARLRALFPAGREGGEDQAKAVGSNTRKKNMWKRHFSFVTGPPLYPTLIQSPCGWRLELDAPRVGDGVWMDCGPHSRGRVVGYDLKHPQKLRSLSKAACGRVAWLYSCLSSTFSSPLQKQFRISCRSPSPKLMTSQDFNAFLEKAHPYQRCGASSSPDPLRERARL